MKRKAAFILKIFFTSLGVLFLLAIILSFTSIPYKAYHHLAATDVELPEPPTTIIVLSGVGMPSPDALIKLYFARKVGEQFPKSTIYIALPEKNVLDSLSPIQLMKNELILNKIDSKRIFLSPKGHNTFTQLSELSKVISTSESILIVTSPEHMLRSILTMKKLGYNKVGGLPTFEEPSEEVLLQSRKAKKTEVDNLNLRYNMWSYLQYEIKVVREYFALTYYWLKGWI
tara:strand:+ start:2965 stop:3651 length:687 start_codon:yes stop_codon:yes gene_type:complete